MDTLKLLLGRLRPDHARAKVKIANDLKFLRQKIDCALADLEAGEALDEHLIQNATGTTHDIIHYNVARDLLPYLEEPKE